MGRVAATIANFVPFTRYPARGTSEACNLCGGEKRRVVSNWDRRLKKLTTVICLDCGLMRTDPMPTEDELKDYYAARYRSDYQLARRAPPRYHRLRGERRAEERAQFLAAVLKPGARVLDVGSGAGEFLAAAKARGCSPVGLEPGEDYASFARRAHDVDVRQHTWDCVDFPAGAFNVITCHHVLEHLRRPVDALRKMAEWVADDGVVYVSVPDVSAGRNPAYERLHFAHVHGFTPETLMRCAREAGLVVDERFVVRGATMVFRKRRAGDIAAAEGDLAPIILKRMTQTSAAAYILGLGFLGPMLRRNLQTAADSLRPG